MTTLALLGGVVWVFKINLLSNESAAPGEAALSVENEDSLRNTSRRQVLDGEHETNCVS